MNADLFNKDRINFGKETSEYVVKELENYFYNSIHSGNVDKAIKTAYKELKVHFHDLEFSFKREDLDKAMYNLITSGKIKAISFIDMDSKERGISVKYYRGYEGKLIHGYIPAHTVCPYRIICEIAQGGYCNHDGITHNVPFSCGSARGFDIIKK